MNIVHTLAAAAPGSVSHHQFFLLFPLHEVREVKAASTREREVTSNRLCEDNLINGRYDSINSEFFCLLPEALLLPPHQYRKHQPVSLSVAVWWNQTDAGLLVADIVCPEMESYDEEEAALLNKFA